MPSGLPDFVQPDFSRANVDRLKNDIPKWGTWMSSESRTEWSDLLESWITQMSSSPPINNDYQ